jgi:hypothetical protein
VTDWLTRLRPEPGGGMDPAIATPTEDDGVVTRLLEIVEGALGHVPTIVWVVALAAVTVTALITLPIAKRRIRAAGAGKAVDLRDRLLLVGALAPAGGFWLAVLLGSARGLTAFGRDDLRWTDGWEYLVPLTLDGVAIAFGLLAFRAVRKDRSPDRAVRVAWGAMIASAAINFGHEAGLANGSYLGGFYLGLMSLLGMLIFDELLAQFEDGTGEVRRKNPKYGLRWLTWPSNTVCAWVAWRNYPPADGTTATVAASVQHLEQVRTVKRARRVTEAQAGTATPWWAPILPWVWISRLDAIAESERAAGDKQRAELSAAAEKNRAVAEQTRIEWAQRVAAIESERDAERSRLTAEAASVRADLDRIGEAHRAEVAALRRAVTDAVEKARAELAETVTELEAKHTAELARVRAESSTVRLTDYRRDHPGGRRSGKAGKTPPTSPITDEHAVQMLLAMNDDPSHEWSQAEVRRVTGVGFARAARLVTAVADYHRRTGNGEGPGSPPGESVRGLTGDGSDDAEERSA